MTPEHTAKLFDKFPQLFSHIVDRYGLEHGDGWFKLISDLAEAIDAECRKHSILPGEPGYPYARQVKEKFGTLRFYLGWFGEEEDAEPDAKTEAFRQRIFELIRDADRISSVTCEMCGAPGELRRDGLHRVMCVPCNTAYLNRSR